MTAVLCTCPRAWHIAGSPDCPQTSHGGDGGGGLPVRTWWLLLALAVLAFWLLAAAPIISAVRS